MKKASQNGRWGIPSCNYFEDGQGGHRQSRHHSYSFEVSVLTNKRQHIIQGESGESPTPPREPCEGTCCRHVDVHVSQLLTSAPVVQW